MHVLLADRLDNERAALKRLLDDDPELSVIAEAGAAEELLARLQESRPDLVLLDWDLPGLPPFTVMGALQCLQCPLKVIVFGENSDARQEALSAGADAFISKEEPVEALLNTVRALCRLSPCCV